MCLVDVCAMVGCVCMCVVNAFFNIFQTLWLSTFSVRHGVKCVCTTRTSITYNNITKCVCRVWLYLHACQCSVVTNFDLFVDNVHICSVKSIFLSETPELALCFDVYVL